MSTTRKTVAIFWRESKRYPWLVAGATLMWPLGIALQDMGLPLIIGLAINKLVEVNQAGQALDWSIFAPYLFGFIAVALAGQLVIYNALMAIVRLQTTLRQNLENMVYKWLLAHSMSFHANSFGGALVNQANRFATAYVAITDIVITQGINVFTKFAGAIIVLLFLAWPIAIALFLWTVFFVWVNITLTRRRMKLSRIAAAADTVLTAHLADSISNVGAIKSFAREADEAEAYAGKSQDRARKKYLAWQKAVRNGTATALMMSALQFIVLTLSIYLVMEGVVQIGTLLLVQVYVVQLMASLWNLSSLTRGLEQNFSDAEEMTEILHSDPEVQDAKHPQPFTVKKGAIHMDHFDFRHSDSEGEPLFKNFDLRIAPGEKVGLVGHSGSGKTTLTRLLLRFANVDQGKITVDGQDISKVRQADLRANIAYVPQEPLLFHRSIHENIAYGQPDATREQVARAARQANAAEFIEQLPKGYETMVGERGVKLSGGQRQRIAIARAILKDAPILVLDEATSALDSESEKLIQDALKKLMKGRTTIVIAHRLSTIQNMDRIVVLDKGRITEQGSHADLLKRGGTYAELWAHQSGGFIED